MPRTEKKCSRRELKRLSQLSPIPKGQAGGPGAGLQAPGISFLQPEEGVGCGEAPKAGLAGVSLGFSTGLSCPPHPV